MKVSGKTLKCKLYSQQIRQVGNEREERKFCSESYLYICIVFLLEFSMIYSIKKRRGRSISSIVF